MCQSPYCPSGPVLAAVSHLHGISQVILIELRQIFREENIAGADFSFFVLHNSIHGNGIVLNQFMADGENIKPLTPEAALPMQ